MPTLLTPYRIPLLQLHLARAIPTQILRQRARLLARDAVSGTRGGGVEVGLGEGGGGVGFAGHGCEGFAEGVGRWGC